MHRNSCMCGDWSCPVCGHDLYFRTPDELRQIDEAEEEAMLRAYQDPQERQAALDWHNAQR